MCRWVVFICLGTSTAASASDPPPAADWLTVERVVAVINDDLVLASDVDRRATIDDATFAALTDPAERERRRTAALQALVDDLLVLQEAARLHMTTSDAEVTAAVEEIKTANNLNDQQLTRALADSKLSMAEYRAELGRQLLRHRVLSYVLVRQLVISDEALQAAYDAEKQANPGLGDFASESARLRTELMSRAFTVESAKWLADQRRRAYLEFPR
jgi:parvulin-like peptidyl-prolyl isomerase